MDGAAEPEVRDEGGNGGSSGSGEDDSRDVKVLRSKVLMLESKLQYETAALQQQNEELRTRMLAEQRVAVTTALERERAAREEVEREREQFRYDASLLRD